MPATDASSIYSIDDETPKRERALLAGTGLWRLDPSDYTLNHTKNGYWFRLTDMTTPANILEWIMQVRCGSIAGDAQTIYELINVVHLVFGRRLRTRSKASIRARIDEIAGGSHGGH